MRRGRMLRRFWSTFRWTRDLLLRTTRPRAGPIANGPPARTRGVSERAFAAVPRLRDQLERCITPAWRPAVDKLVRTLKGCRPCAPSGDPLRPICCLLPEAEQRPWTRHFARPTSGAGSRVRTTSDTMRRPARAGENRASRADTRLRSLRERVGTPRAPPGRADTEGCPRGRSAPWMVSPSRSPRLAPGCSGLLDPGAAPPRVTSASPPPRSAGPKKRLCHTPRRRWCRRGAPRLRRALARRRRSPCLRALPPVLLRLQDRPAPRAFPRERHRLLELAAIRRSCAVDLRLQSSSTVEGAVWRARLGA